MKLLGKWLLGSLALVMAMFSIAAEPVKGAEKQVVLATNKGDIVLSLSEAEAPISVENFLNYVGEGFYDGLVFHRVIKDFMIQGGGFTQDMSQKETGKPINNESMQRGRLENRRGTIAMARTQIVDSATSQFFINLKDNHFLNGQSRQPGYAVFGHVVKGMDVVDQIATVKTGYHGSHGDVPLDPVIIEKAYVLEAEKDAGQKES